MSREQCKLVQCAGCHGEGGKVDVVLEDGSGPFDECGYCKGTGRTSRQMNYWIMRWRKDPDWIPSAESEKKHLSGIGKRKHGDQSEEVRDD